MDVRTAIQGVARRGIGVDSRIAGEHGSSHGVWVQKSRGDKPQHQPPEAG